MFLGGRGSVVLCPAFLFLFLFFETSAGSSIDSGTYYRDKTLDDLLPTEVAEWFSAVSKLQCAIRCQAAKGCNSFFYHHGDISCALQRMAYWKLWTNQTVAAPGWMYYRLTSALCPTQNDYVIDRVTATCYRLVTSKTLNWLAARAACNSSSEMLVVLEPVEKARFLREFLNTNKALHDFKKSFNIGVSRPYAEWNQFPVNASLVWVNGKPLNLSATQPFWRNGFVWDLAAQNYVLMKHEDQFLWTVARKNYERFYVCEKSYL